VYGSKQLTQKSTTLSTKKKAMTLSTSGVSHCGLAIHIRRQKENYGNSNISPCKNIIFKKSFKRNQNP
jgi:hypothetical protein